MKLVHYLAFIFLEIVNSQEVHVPIQGMNYCLCIHYTDSEHIPLLKVVVTMLEISD